MSSHRSLLSVSLACSLAVSSAAQTGRAPITILVSSRTLKLGALLWTPAGRGPFPAVLYNHGSGPQSDEGRAALLGPLFARHGYVLLYLFRRGAGLSADQGTDSDTRMARALRGKGQDGRNELQLQLLDAESEDVRAGLAFLRTRRGVDPHRIAVVGYSFGGQLALLLAEQDPALRAAVVFSAAGASWTGSPPLRARLLHAVGQTRVPVFFIHAANDYSVESGETMAAEMARLGKPHRLQIYPPIGRTAADGHDFVHLGVSIWEPDVFAFLDERTAPAQ